MITDSPVLKSLPIGIQSFAELREGGYIYVDKTADIYRLVTDISAVILSRPRLFGKTLLISTIEELFKGNEALFKGLAIHDKWDWKQKYPVVRIDWSRFAYSSMSEVKRLLALRIQEIAAEYGVELGLPSLANLVKELRKKTGQRVVVLIDNHDKPMLDVAYDHRKYEDMQTYLNSLYGVLKAVSEHIEFLLLAGTSIYTPSPLFAGPNHLYDITTGSRYASLCGFTQEELKVNFADYIEETAKSLNTQKTQFLDKVKSWYDGYTWDGKTSVYNPFSILMLLNKKRFSNFWFETGKPSLPIEIVKTRDDIDISSLMKPASVWHLSTPTFDVPTADLHSLLFLTGYLAIKEKPPARGLAEFILDFPNLEVRQSLLKKLFDAYFQEGTSGLSVSIEEMAAQLRSGAVKDLEINLHKMFFILSLSRTTAKYRAFYHMFMLLWLRLIGFEIESNNLTDKSDIIAVWELSEQKIVVEIKFDNAVSQKKKLLDEVFAQMHSRNYAERYTNFPGKISLLAIAFYGRDATCRLEVLKEK